jgi:hypothetical protein
MESDTEPRPAHSPTERRSTVNENLVNRVRRLRAVNPFVPMSITSAFAQARMEANPPADYPFLLKLTDSPMTVTGEVDGLTVTVQVVSDDDWQLGDDDVTVSFGDEYHEGAVRYTINGLNGQGCKYYYPSNMRMSGDERPYWQAMGLSRSQVTEYERWVIQQDMRDDADRSYVGVIATVSVDGTELGESSLWGIDCPLWGYDNKPYIIEVAGEQVSEAIDQAKDNAADIVKAARATAAKVERLLVTTTASHQEE